ncbi:hypothetical protein PYCC9005_000358 [Savitreella phatthalungensis]
MTASEASTRNSGSYPKHKLGFNVWQSPKPTKMLTVEIPGTTVQPDDLSRTLKRRGFETVLSKDTSVVRDRPGRRSVIYALYDTIEEARKAAQDIGQVYLNGDKLKPVYSMHKDLPRRDMLVSLYGTESGAVSLEGLPADIQERHLMLMLRAYNLVDQEEHRFHRIYRTKERSAWIVRLKSHLEAQRLARDADFSAHRSQDTIDNSMLRAEVFQ